jgi:hypothetical protein
MIPKSAITVGLNTNSLIPAGYPTMWETVDLTRELA